MRFLLPAGSLLAVLMLGQFQPANPQLNVQEYYDREYGYFFKHPATWKLQRMPEGDANKDIRLMLQGPNNSSFMVIIDRTRKTLKTDFESPADRTQRVGEMMQQTIEQIYQTISANIKALDMKIGERRDLSNNVGVKFYIATLHTMKAGKPIIVAGIHAFPFNQDYSINFTLTTFWNPEASQENEMLTEVFNSFGLMGEPRTTNGPAKPPENKEESR
jgi:hypothetical protein